MSSKEPQKSVTPLNEGAKPPAMTPVGGEYRGLKAVPMTPVQPQQPTPAPTQSTETPKK